MNPLFLEERSKEKVRDLLNEGVTSQAYYRQNRSRIKPFRKLLYAILATLKSPRRNHADKSLSTFHLSQNHLGTPKKEQIQ